MKAGIIIFLSIISVSSLSGQNAGFNVLYKSSFQFGPQLQTYGVGFTTSFGRQINADNTLLTNFNLNYSINPRQVSKVNRYHQETRPYVYAKKNEVLTTSLSFGNNKVFADRISSSSVRVSATYSAGISAAIIKPIYIGIIEHKPDDLKYSVTIVRYEPEIHTDESLIYGSYGFLEGINKAYYIPGLTANLGLSFEWGNYDYKFRAISTGIKLDAYMVEIEEFAFVQNKKFFPNLYLNLVFGKRW